MTLFSMYFRWACTTEDEENTESLKAIMMLFPFPPDAVFQSCFFFFAENPVASGQNKKKSNRGKKMKTFKEDPLKVVHTRLLR